MSLKTFVVDGDKGGVGKTMVSRLLAETYLRGEELGLPKCQLMVADADKTNPDFCGEGGYETCDQFGSMLVDLSAPRLWGELANDLEGAVAASALGEVRVVINLPAGIGERSLLSADRSAIGVLEYLRAVPVWVMGRTEDSISQLERRWKEFPKTYEHGLVVLNQFFGDKDRFVMWNSSQVRRDLLDGDWKEVAIPELSDLTVQRIGRTPLFKVAKGGTTWQGLRVGPGDVMNVRAFTGMGTSILKIAETIPSLHYNGEA
ncbi:conserved hypothetical protein [Thiomonas sp. X19]|uniref:hypothetical protein n=1 Tax=Thiomonas sp. X19 TaxID=1050370 RepID=UPI000B636FD6|nr:hypothetical protein [Thiomonas sp. X19]SCC93608.1 conserved hypothetical protein [Thiomonas sp. X19]